MKYITINNKRIVNFTILCCLLSLTACTRTDGNIVGKWRGYNDDGEAMSSVITISIYDSGEYKKHTTLNIFEQQQTVTERGKWEKNGNTIKFTETTTESGNPLTTAYDIKELSDNILTLSSTERGKEYKWKYQRIK